MAGPFQYVTTNNFFSYTPTAAGSFTGFPPTLMGDWNGTRPLVRAWRAGGITPNAINFAFGGVRSGTWVAILNANFTTLGIGIGNGTTFTDIMTGSPSFTMRTITQDLQDPEGYYKFFLPTAYSGSVGRFEIPAQSTTDGAPYFRIGLAAWGNNIVTMSHNFFAPLTEDYVDPEYRVEGKDWTEGYPAGIRYKTLTPRQRFRTTQSAQWHRLRLIRPSERILAFFNLDDSSEVYLWERNRGVSISRQGISQEIDTGFRTIS